MKAAALALLLLALAGCSRACDGENTKDCGYACERAGHMLKYVAQTGECTCAGPDGGTP